LDGPLKSKDGFFCCWSELKYTIEPRDPKCWKRCCLFLIFSKTNRPIGTKLNRNARWVILLKSICFFVDQKYTKETRAQRCQIGCCLYYAVLLTSPGSILIMPTTTCMLSSNLRLAFHIYIQCILKCFWSREMMWNHMPKIAEAVFKSK
jgi:hypothetical protein